MNTQADYLYLELAAPDELHETLVVLLDELGQEGAWSDGDTLQVYFPAKAWAPEALLAAAGALLASFAEVRLLGCRLQEGQNWNAIWEANYPTIELGTFCQVVPGFREPKPGFTHTLRITAAMAFGTGHHATTRLVMQLMQNLHPMPARVLDHGCGTGILGILAGKMGAQSLFLSDYDEISAQATTQNLALNGLTGAEVQTGTIYDLDFTHHPAFDLILANINRNVLLEEGARYAKLLAPRGQLFLSGFIEVDYDTISDYFTGLGLTPQRSLREAEWCALAFTKA
jgi:ribosomal protein L11 methyltransferase